MSMMQFLIYDYKDLTNRRDFITIRTRGNGMESV